VPPLCRLRSYSCLRYFIRLAYSRSKPAQNLVKHSRITRPSILPREALSWVMRARAKTSSRGFECCHTLRPSTTPAAPPLNQTGRCAHLWFRDRSRGRKTSAREPSVQSLWLEYEPAGNGAVFNQAMAVYGVLQGEATREDDLHISLHHQFKGALHLLQRGGK
jgi:hypothetical protein